ncbi:NitT/TauT family transport system substrate-binding protein [Pseudonocardia thermophila]|jgi:ABC-type nitrate/sulfonate/bicarbonate transport systems, periplasmic components|uniref:NitT/TauT family transport system substrate-binding protein n=1 Tax=Pseudonocardia thermophila TaxID=1848 RepID=A0A1M6UEM7_PSETH|nr:ABC transporter substrate-binding protein [Pseudonocardia thermophila]SHK67702.1 NitT/TauT family transport system substrate-binding protein [Pseudonocardia thermophila]
MSARRIVAALLAAATLVLAGCGTGGSSGGSGDGSTEPVRVAHVVSTLFSPLYIAEAKGYFADAGIRIQLQPVKSGQDAVPLAANRQLDVVVAGFSAGLFNAIQSGLQIKVVGSMAVSDGKMDDPPSALVVSKALVDSGQVRSVADLRGRRIAIAGGPGSSGGYLTDRMLRTGGLTLRDIQPVNLANPDMPAAVESGAVDAATTSAPFNVHMERAGTGVPLAVPPAGNKSTGVIFGAHFVTDDRAQRFFSALARGARDLQGDQAKSEENLRILAAATQQDVETVRSLPLYEWLPDLAPSPEDMSAMQQTYLDAGLLEYSEPMDPATFVETRFAAGARET